MSRKILCPKCKASLQHLAIKYNELFEFEEGKAINHMMCDDCGKHISSDEVCFASVLLPDKNHFNYEIQKPSSWSFDYIT